MGLDHKIDTSAQTQPKASRPSNPIAAAAAALRLAAGEALRKARGDFDRGAKILRKIVAANRKYQEILLARAIRDEIRGAAGDVRAAAWPAPNPDRAAMDGGAQSLGDLTERCLMEFPVPGGKAIGDCTRPELRAAAAQWLALAKTNGDHGRLAALAADVLTDDITTVRKALTEKKLRDLQREAAGDVGRRVRASKAARRSR